jgi:hypothetical protein
MTWLPPSARSDDLPAIPSANSIPAVTAVYHASDQPAELQQVNWRYGYYGPRYYSYGYRYPSYGYRSYSYPRYYSYRYGYPRYGYGYNYPRYGYGYGYPSYGYRYSYRPGISFGFRF